MAVVLESLRKGAKVLGIGYGVDLKIVFQLSECYFIVIECSPHN